MISCILILIPLTADNFAETQLTLRGFDSKLIDFDSPLGITVTEECLIIQDTKDSSPFITTITTPASFKIDVTVSVLKQSNKSMPVQIGIWDPQTLDTLGIIFSSPGNSILVGARKSDTIWEVKENIGYYEVNCQYFIKINYVKHSHAEILISNSTWSSTFTVKNVSILEDPMVNLSFFATDFEDESISVFSEYKVVLPSQSYYNYIVGSWELPLIILYTFLVFLIIFLWKAKFMEFFRCIKSFLLNMTKKNPRSRKNIISILGILILAVVIQVLLSTLGSHPYDMFTMKVWSYITTQYGLKSLYPMSLLIPTGQSLQTISTINSVFPYPPFSAYFFGITGRAFSILSPSFDFNSNLLELIVKIQWIIAINVTGILIYFFIKKKKNYSHKTALVLMTLCILNLGIIVEPAIWGQFSVVLGLFLILSIIGLELDSPFLTWVFLALSLLTKATSVVAVGFISIIALRKFGFRRAFSTLGFPLVLIFLVLIPFLMSGYSPWFIFNVSAGENVLNVVREIPKGVAGWQMTVSSSAFNIWPILTGVLNGQSSWSRFTFPDYLPNQIFNLSYVTFGTYLVLLYFAFLLLIILFSKEENKFDSSKIFFIIYLVMFSLYMLNTRMHERHLIYVFPLLLLAFPWIKNKKFFSLIFGLLSFTSFVSIYGTLVVTNIGYPSFLTNFNPNSNIINHFTLQFFTNDLLISIICLVNVIVFILSTFLLLVREKRAHELQTYNEE